MLSLPIDSPAFSSHAGREDEVRLHRVWDDQLRLARAADDHEGERAGGEASGRLHISEGGKLPIGFHQ